MSFLKKDQSAYLASEKRLFWMALFIAPAIWFVFGIGALFSLLSLNPVSKLPNLLTIAVALGLTLPNLYGYMKCSKGTKQNRKFYVFANVFDFRCCRFRRETERTRAKLYWQCSIECRTTKCEIKHTQK